MLFEKRAMLRGERLVAEVKRRCLTTRRADAAAGRFWDPALELPDQALSGWADQDDRDQPAHRRHRVSLGRTVSWSHRRP